MNVLHVVNNGSIAFKHTHTHRQVSKYIKVACLHNLPSVAACRQSMLVSCELRENEPDEIDLPDVQVLHNPSFAPSPYRI